MTQQFTASEVRELAATIWPDLSGREEVAETLNAYADLLEAREKAVPVAYAAGLEANMRGFLDVMAWSEGEFTIPLYTHPAPSDAEKRDTMTPRELAKRIERGEKWKLADEPAPCQSQNANRLAEALRRTCRKMKTFSRTGALDGAVAVWVDEIESAIAAHATEAAQAQAQSGEWTPDLPQAYAVFWKAYQLANDCGHPQTSCYENGAMAVVYWAKKAMLAAAPQQAAEPVRQFRVVPKGSVWTDVKDPEIWASVTAHPKSYETRVLYTHPQPAQDAKESV